MTTREIVRRKSTRTFMKKNLSSSHQEQIKAYLNLPENLIGPNKTVLRVEFIHTDGSTGSGKIGTYGFIKDPRAFIVIICNKTHEALIDCGYVFERFILFLESLDIGSCWVAGTFKRKQLNYISHLKDDEFIPAVIPIGYKREKPTWNDKTIRKISKFDQRKNFDTLFFSKDFDTPITDKETRELLQYVRLAPSATNKQPWRVVMENQVAHFFIEHAPGYGENSKLSFDVQLVDMGIALSHYEIAKGNVTFALLNPEIPTPKDTFDYVMSIIPN